MSGYHTYLERVEKERDQLAAKLAEYERWSGDAIDAVARLQTHFIANGGGLPLTPLADVQAALTAAYARGAAEEREACAKIADEWMTREQIKFGKGGAGAAIRSRKGGEHE